MTKSNAFATLEAALKLRERHPDASPSVVLVALCMASFADGATGTKIFPGQTRVVRMTGLSESTVRRAWKWLEGRGEMRRDRQGTSRHVASCFTWIGGMNRGRREPSSGVTVTGNWGHPEHPTSHDPLEDLWGDPLGGSRAALESGTKRKPGPCALHKIEHQLEIPVEVNERGKTETHYRCLACEEMLEPNVEEAPSEPVLPEA